MTLKIFERHISCEQGSYDADLGGDLDGRKSTIVYVFTRGGTAVSWMSQLQKSVFLSTT